MLLNDDIDLLDVTSLPEKTNGFVFDLSFNLKLPPRLSMKSDLKIGCYIFD